MYWKAIEQKDEYFASRFHLGIMYHKNLQFDDALLCFSQVLDKKDKSLKFHEVYL